MDILQKILDDEMRKRLEEATSEEELQKIEGTLADTYERVIESTLQEMPEQLLVSMEAELEEDLIERRNNHAEFVERNTHRWREAFDLFELHIEIAIEAGQEVNERLRPQALKNNDALFEVLVRLHAKGCMVSKEILTLLKNGYADGAHARWRALHELAVTAMFLQKHGKEAAIRYLAHEAVEAYKGAAQLNKYEARINESGFSEEEIQILKDERDAVVEKFGKEFKRQYGWAKPFLAKGNDTFFALEEDLQLDHWRPYYKWASQNVHAGVKTIRSSLGLVEAKEDLLQVGPSNAGMMDPGHSTALSLMQLTYTLLTLNPNIDELVIMKVMEMLEKKIGNAFIKGGAKKSYED